MFRQSKVDSAPNRYIRTKIKEARTEANESQETLAEAMQKSRVSISDIERGRVEISASDLGFIAAHYEKPISYFFPPRVVVNKDELSKLDEELLFLFFQLPDTQKLIAIEYLKNQVEIVNKAKDKENLEKFLGNN
jgi:transcriptional regulator with XRE-family HTH domain